MIQRLAKFLVETTNRDVLKLTSISVFGKSSLFDNEPTQTQTPTTTRRTGSRHWQEGYQRKSEMGVPFDFAPERPEHIDTILNGLDRYNPETTQVFQDYVTEQCESKTYDCYANLALLKL